MSLTEKYIRPCFWVLTASAFLFVLQSVWMYHTYQQEHFRLVTELKEAFAEAYQKEQTYRVPVVDIVNPGELSIQSCGSEEIMIVRKCSLGDTIVYNNISGRSIEKFIDRVFRDLRESIVPMNIYCLSDLFGGMLHDKDIPATFTIERYNIASGEVLETTLPPGKVRIQTAYDSEVVIELSDTEAVRAILQITPGIIFRNMASASICTCMLVVLVLLCISVLYRVLKRKDDAGEPDIEHKQTQDSFCIGKYSFDPSKNELRGFDEVIQLNKKENSILQALCIQQGNVVERNVLLEDNWGSSGVIYSRSLDTYLATLRKYLKKDPGIQIITVKGVGYKLVYKEV
ncbi:winged helix family transcriptional regulator [Dysgonomonas sp. 521]|uniref:winged helix-turn-helix domain-containing protein n=1 Tax=Dysgonomonas sp. 521 TaxID=2302932 RepID=UPI0013D83021|nr:winged helix-turn-helix domain-containing protein [Dysgonomonas sp. 521]NDV97595.1 winged helix family transcriptional regulator [Dysgonomonas sp. 521]